VSTGKRWRLLMKFKGDEDKYNLLERGLELISEFSIHNKIRKPRVFIYDGENKNAYGLFYPDNVIQINIKSCRTPVKTPGYDWTFPGYVQDLTPYGILAHEFGHYISDRLGKQFRKNFIKIHHIESNVTSSDNRGLDEKMAEAARLFLTNPDLLKKGRPLRYQIFREYYEPIIKHRWKTVLKNAHPKIIAAAENWIKR
jgi:hypothetical protein